MTLVLDIAVDKQVEILATLKLQYADLVARGCITSTAPIMSCRMAASAPSFFFCNNLFTAAQAFASTRVMLKQQGNVVKSSVHVKRNMQGELMDAIVMKGPSYKLNSTSSCTDPLLTLHASTALFNVYSSIMHALHGSPEPVLVQMPALPGEVAQVKFDYQACLAATLPLFQALPTAPAPVVPVPEPAPVVCQPALPPPSPPAPMEDARLPSTLSPLSSPERPSKRQRTGATPSTCYICFKHKTCDMLFPCRVASHACCRKCIKRLYEMWSSDEYDGKATIKCPQCGCKKGLIERTDGKEVWLGSRYLLRKKRRPSYVPVHVSF